MSIVAEATCWEAGRLWSFAIPAPAAVRAGMPLKTGPGTSGRCYTPTGKGLGLDSSSMLAAPLRQRSKRPCNRLMRPVYQ
jgi:hypothetical protein